MGNDVKLHGPGFDAKVDGRHLSAQKAMTGLMYRRAIAGTWTTHKEQAAELTKLLGGEAFETAAAGARMRSLRGKPSDDKGGRGWTLTRRRRQGARAYEYCLDLTAGEACPHCGGEGCTGPEGDEVGCDVCHGSGTRAVQAPDGSGPARDVGGQTMLGDFAAAGGAHQQGVVKA